MKALLKKIPFLSTVIKKLNGSDYMMRLRARKQFKQRYFPIPSEMGGFGENAFIEYPVYFDNPSTVFIEENVKIRNIARFVNSANERIFIKKYTVVGSDCMIITNSHQKTVGVPQFLLGTSHINDKKHDLVVGEDVWIGARVTLLPNASIGRGCIIGAGSMVTHPVPPYSVVVGSPAKIIGKVYELDDIIKHESMLYSPQERMNRQDLEELFNNNNYDKLKTYGKNTPLSATDNEVIDRLKKEWNFVEPTLNADE